MTYTTEELEEILTLLTPGCTALWKNTVEIIINPDGTAKLKGINYDQNWDIQKHATKYRNYLSDFCTPAGKDILNPNKTRKSPVEKKCQKLWNSSKYVKTNPAKAY